MPKQPYFESAIHHLLVQMRKLAEIERLYAPEKYADWQKFIGSFLFRQTAGSKVSVNWLFPEKGKYEFSLGKVDYYVRGDTEAGIVNQAKMIFRGDPVKERNDRNFFELGRKIAQKAGFKLEKVTNLGTDYDGVSMKRFYDEEDLSKSWAKTVDVSKIDVRAMNESVTAPEMRYIVNELGDIRGKSLLDIGCGLGEASVYFALKGAEVTATDISAAMINVTIKLAKRYGVIVNTYQSSIEHLKLPKRKKFDIVYVGNLFHHVNIDRALEQIGLFIKPNGALVCWEPVHYNPIINIYRKIAVKVRSKDERPLKFADINKFRKYFRDVKFNWFWLTTLLIFIIMVFVQRRDPNKERFWKAVVIEGSKWKPIYAPLAKFDHWLLERFPILKPLCWNVVIIARGVRG